jgi:hypothetical protein
MPICGQQRVREMESIAAGMQEVPYTCSNEATEKVSLGDRIHDMCSECASDAVNDFSALAIKKSQERDAATLRQYADTMAAGVSVWASRPAIARWFEQCAIQLEELAVDVLEGKL